MPAALIIAGVADRTPSVRAPILAVLAFVWVALPWTLYLHAHRTGEEPAAAIVPVGVLALLIAAYRLRVSPTPA